MEESDARQLQHELPRLTDQRSVHSAEGPGNGGAGGPVGAPKIVSSSMHHFTVQVRDWKKAVCGRLVVLIEVG